MRKNLFLSLISAFSKILGGIALLAVLARVFELDQFGDFTYALTLATVLGLLVDYGYNLKIIKDVSGNQSQVGQVVSKAFIGKSALFALTSFIFLLSNEVLDNSDTVNYTVLFFFLALSAFSYTNIILSVFKGKEEFGNEAFIVVVDNVLTVLIVISVAVKTNDILWSSAAFFLAKMVALGLALMLYRKGNSMAKPSWAEIRKDLYITLPYAVHYWVGSMYLNIDTIIMETMVPADEIAIYQAGIRIIIGAGILLTIINSVFLPALNKLLLHNRQEFDSGIAKLNAITIKYALIIIVMLIVFSKWIVLILYGPKFEELNQIIWIIAFIIGMRIIGVTYGILLTISDRQKIRAIAGFLSIVLIVILDFAFIPEYGYVSAAYVLLAAHFFINAFYLITVYKEYNSIFFPSFRNLFTLKFLP